MWQKYELGHESTNESKIAKVESTTGISLLVMLLFHLPWCIMENKVSEPIFSAEIFSKQRNTCVTKHWSEH